MTSPVLCEPQTSSTAPASEPQAELPAAVPETPVAEQPAAAAEIPSTEPPTTESAPAAPAPDSTEPAAPVSQPWLVIIRGQKPGREYPVYPDLNFIGRSDEQPVDIDLEDQETPE